MDLFKPTYLKMGTPINRARPPTSIRPPTLGGQASRRDFATTEDSGTTVQVNMPTYEAGDLVVVCLKNDTLAADFQAPTGWTEGAINAGADAAVYYREMDGTEGSTVDFTQTASAQFVGAIAIVHRGLDWSVYTPDFSGMDATTNAPQVTLSHGAAATYDVYVYAGAAPTSGLPTITDDDGYTEVVELNLGDDDPWLWLGTKQITGATTEDPNFVITSVNGLHLCTFAIVREAAKGDLAAADHTHVEADVTDLAHTTTLDHGVLTGLSDDDHTLYVKADGTRAFTGVVSGVTPTANAHLATKGYVDAGDTGGGGATPDYAYDKTDNADAADVQWDGTQSSGMTTVTVTGSQTITEKTGVLSVKYSGQLTQDYNCLLGAHTFTVGDSFAVPLRLYSTGSLAQAGVIFTDGTASTSNGVAAHLQKVSTEFFTRMYTRHGTLTAMSTVSTQIDQRFNEVPWMWLRLTYQAANTFRKEISPDGISWTTAGISDVSKTMTPTHVGVCWTMDNQSGDGIATFGPIVKLA